MRFYVGVHSLMEGPLGLAIRTLTEARCKPPWVLGPAHPASHAYVVWTHDDATGYYWMDAHQSGARISMTDKPDRGIPHAHWELSHELIRAALRKAVELDGIAYDDLELASQLIPAADSLPFFKHAMVCTHVVQEVLEAAGGPAEALSRGLPDRFPEHMARSLANAEGAGWLTRAS